MFCFNVFYVNGNNISGELGFFKKFYERMGRRFGVWGNFNLCYYGDEIKNFCDYVFFGVN